MSMIFDNFPNVEQAGLFAASVSERFGLDAQVFETEQAAQEHDLFPFELSPPIVHVDRAVDEAGFLVSEQESLVMAAVGEFGGEFAGT